MEDRQDERRMLADSVDNFIRKENTLSRARKLREEGVSHSRETWSELASLGWLGILVPEECGGMGLGISEMAVVAEGLGKARMPEPFTAVAGLAASVIAAGDKAGLCGKLLEQIATGEKLIGVAWQESRESATQDVLETRISEASSGAALSGRKFLVIPAEADEFIVSAQAEAGVGLYRIAADAAGVSIDRRTQVDGTQVADIRFSDVSIGEDSVIASPTAGSGALARGLAYGQVLASAELLGLGESLFELTSEYLSRRKQFGQPLSAFQVLRHRMVNLYIQRELTRAALRHALAVLERGDEDMMLLAASRAKARASSAAMLLAREAVQLHGAIGYTEEADVGVYLHRVLVLSAWLGDAAWHRRRYAQLLQSQHEEIA